ncbi:hypothetical protein [Nostoc sp.]
MNRESERLVGSTFPSRLRSQKEIAKLGNFKVKQNRYSQQKFGNLINYG